jgi:pimeloyl-ACP methyl ester carboxylesterase
LRAALLVALYAGGAQAGLGLTEIPGEERRGPVTVFYSSASASAPVERGPFRLEVAVDGKPARGNGRLVVVSHGSGGSPWVYTDLAAALVEAGFIVALPEHRGDNHRDSGGPGPESWKQRPREVAAAIDAVGADERFRPLLALDKVGMFGMSAGGHTALSLAGGRWSPRRLLEHCEAHLDEDFHGCVGLSARLTGGAFDGVKKSIALWVMRSKLDDATWYEFRDARIAAIVAGVPFAADFEPGSLAAPGPALGLVTARQDRWLVPAFHSDPIAAACTRCERVADFPRGGHGALLSPLPPGISGLLAELLADPPGFDRGEVAQANARIVAFLQRHLR